MNTTERIVESYFRLCRKCFTYPDLKVIGGNNRQLDLLAYNMREDAQYHVETSVTHELSWRATWERLEPKFNGKFFGTPREKEGANTDFGKGKLYLNQIRRTYKSVGFSPAKVQRIWVTWVVPEGESFKQKLKSYCKSKRLGSQPIRVLSFRDRVLPDLLSEVGKSNYNDDALRTLSLLRQYKKQVESNSHF